MYTHTHTHRTYELNSFISRTMAAEEKKENAQTDNVVTSRRVSPVTLGGFINIYFYANKRHPAPCDWPCLPSPHHHVCLRVTKKCGVRGTCHYCNSDKHERNKKSNDTSSRLVVLDTNSTNAISRFHIDSCILKSSDTNNSWFSGILQTCNTKSRDPRFSWCTMVENSCPVLHVNYRW